MPGLWRGGPSASAFLRDKGARWAGSTRAWLWQGRGRQEQAPSGLETQAQHSHPPTYPSCAQDPTAAGRLKLSVGAVEGGRGKEKVSCWALACPLACPEVRCRTLDLLATACSQGQQRQGVPQLLGRKKGKEKPSAAYMGVSDSGALIPKKGAWWHLFKVPRGSSRAVPVTTPVTGSACPPWGP